jgi:hypothetical protein
MKIIHNYLDNTSGELVYLLRINSSITSNNLSNELEAIRNESGDRYKTILIHDIDNDKTYRILGDIDENNCDLLIENNMTIIGNNIRIIYSNEYAIAYHFSKRVLLENTETYWKSPTGENIKIEIITELN